jgi:hypothetical protein
MALKNAKGKGARQELRAKHHLELNGYKAMKAGGSLGAFDLIAVNGHALLLVQVKSNCFPPPHERKAIEEFDAPWSALKILWRYDDRKKEPRLKVWGCPFGDWEWLEISKLPELIIHPEHGVAMQFDYTGDAKKKLIAIQDARKLEGWPAEL